MIPIIETDALTHRFGVVQAVQNVGLVVPPGAVYGFLGPNGSGKTTTIRVLLGLLRPQSGRVTILGRNIARDRQIIAREVGSMVETPCLYDHLSGFENIDLTRRALGLRPVETARVLELVELSAFSLRRAGGYSLGMRQRLGIARALLGEPKLLILDEPMNGLDPAGVIDMRELIRDLPRRLGVTVFISSHLLNEVELVASHVGLMFKGRLIVQSTLDDLLRKAVRTLIVGVRNAVDASACLKAADVDCDVSHSDTLSVRLRADTRLDPAAINARLVHAGFHVFSLRVHVPSLEDIFLQHTLALPQPAEISNARPAHQ